jgi:hypothetical protein
MPFDKYEPFDEGWGKEGKKLPKPCTSSEHDPPAHRVYKPGTYTWRCPKCGKTVTFTVPLVTL